MSKENLLFLISNLKKNFDNKEICKMLADIIKCDKCPFRKACWNATYNPPSEKFCEDFMYEAVKGVK